MIRVAVVDDQDLVRAGFVLLLGLGSGSRGRGRGPRRAGGGRAVPTYGARRRADGRPDAAPRRLAATRTILADPACTETRILVLTTFDEDEVVLEALRSGASGFLLKDTRPDQLLEAIEVVAQGEALLHPRVTRRLIERFAALPSRAATQRPTTA